MVLVLAMATKRRRGLSGQNVRFSSPRTLAVRPAVATTGRRLSSSRLPASRNPILLPRSMATAYPARVQHIAFEAWSGRLRREAPQGPARRPGTSQALQELYRLQSRKARAKLIRPLLNPLKTPCEIRSSRKQVIHALGVAGKRWGSGGGPDMRNARRTADSQFTCKRG